MGAIFVSSIPCYCINDHAFTERQEEASTLTAVTVWSYWKLSKLTFINLSWNHHSVRPAWDTIDWFLHIFHSIFYQQSLLSYLLSWAFNFIFLPSNDLAYYNNYIRAYNLVVLACIDDFISDLSYWLPIQFNPVILTHGSFAMLFGSLGNITIVLM